jgi:hypothetical protein
LCAAEHNARDAEALNPTFFAGLRIFAAGFLKPANGN